MSSRLSRSPCDLAHGDLAYGELAHGDRDGRPPLTTAALLTLSKQRLGGRS